ncbi:MAG: CDP-glycerol glycerophosphotransferase family protein [Vicinamibacterales bacterium]
MRNLVHDTAYRRLRRTVLDATHRLDDALARLRGGPRRILFEAASPLSVAVFRPVYQRLRRDPRLTFFLTSSDDRWDGRTIAAQSGMRAEVIAPRDARWTKFDLYLNTDFWNMTWLPRRTHRLHLFHGVAGKYDLDAPTRLAPTVATFDRLLFPNRDRLCRYVAAGLVDPASPTAALVGYPKVDALVDGSLDRAAIMSHLGLDPSRPTLLYAPTWSPYSSLNRCGDHIIRTLAARDANVIVKLHDRSFDAATRASGGVDWRAHLERLSRDCGIHVAVDADASPYLCVADALVTDHSSVAFEFMLLDRPIITIASPGLVEHARINPQKIALMRSAADTVEAVDQLPRALDAAGAEPWRRTEQRRAVAAELFFDPGGASARAAAVVYDVLGLEQPAHLAAQPTITTPLSPWKPELLS